MATPVEKTVLNVRTGVAETAQVDTDDKFIPNEDRADNKGDEYRE